MSAGAIRDMLASLADDRRARAVARYFKARPGEYGEGDVFVGISMPELRAIANASDGEGLESILDLLGSRVHEERMLALLMLVRRYAKGSPAEKAGIFDLYLKNTHSINNWDLVDVSAPHIVGGCLLDKDKGLLPRLARSENLWERRIAVLSTLAFIRKGILEHTFSLARLLLDDREDLIHKALGWMLREAGKRDEGSLRDFLDLHGASMPRTMLRAAIERFPVELRAHYLGLGRKTAPRGKRG